MSARATREKRCGACGDVLPITSFRGDPRTADGLRAQCKLCQREQSRRWYLANKEVADERRRIRNGSRKRPERMKLSTPQTTGAKELGLYPCPSCPGFFRLGDMENHLRLHA